MLFVCTPQGVTETVPCARLRESMLAAAEDDATTYYYYDDSAEGPLEQEVATADTVAAAFYKAWGLSEKAASNKIAASRAGKQPVFRLGGAGNVTHAAVLFKSTAHSKSPL